MLLTPHFLIGPNRSIDFPNSLLTHFIIILHEKNNTQTPCPPHTSKLSPFDCCRLLLHSLPFLLLPPSITSARCLLGCSCCQSGNTMPPLPSHVKMPLLLSSRIVPVPSVFSSQIHPRNPRQEEFSSSSFCRRLQRQFGKDNDNNDCYEQQQTRFSGEMLSFFVHDPRYAMDRILCTSKFELMYNC